MACALGACTVHAQVHVCLPQFVAQLHRALTPVSRYNYSGTVKILICGVDLDVSQEFLVGVCVYYDR